MAKLQSRIYLRINHYYGSWGEVALAEITDGDGSALLADYVGGSVPLDDHVAAHTITWDDMTAVPGDTVATAALRPGDRLFSPPRPRFLHRLTVGAFRRTDLLPHLLAWHLPTTRPRPSAWASASRSTPDPPSSTTGP